MQSPADSTRASPKVRIAIVAVIVLLVVGAGLRMWLGFHRTSTDELAEQLRTGNQREKLQALSALGDRGADNDEALRAVAGALDDEYPLIRYVAVDILSGLGPRAGLVRGRLAEALESGRIDHSHARALAVGVLAETGDGETIPTLVGLLDSGAEAGRRAAADALASLGKEHHEAWDALVDAACSGPADALSKGRGVWAYAALKDLIHTDRQGRRYVERALQGRRGGFAGLLRMEIEDARRDPTTAATQTAPAQ